LLPVLAARDWESSAEVGGWKALFARFVAEDWMRDAKEDGWLELLLFSLLVVVLVSGLVLLPLPVPLSLAVPRVFGSVMVA
jgi:hypothetical protein